MTPLGLLSWVLLLFTCTYAGDVKIKSTEFDKPSLRLVYFDDSSTILSLHDTSIWQSDDNGVSWSDITSSKLGGAKVASLHLDPYHQNRVFVVTNSNKHYVTDDKAQSWRVFEVDRKVSPTSKIAIHENHVSPDHVMVNFIDCSNIFDCSHSYYYTTNGFKTSKLEKLGLDNPVYCSYTSNEAVKDHNDHVLCVVNHLDSRGRLKSSDLLSSEDYFKTSSKIENDGISDSIVYDLEVVHSFVLVKAYSDRYSLDSYVNLYVAKDGKSFRKAHFPGDLKSESFVVLPSNSHSLYLSVWGFKKQMQAGLDGVISDLYVSDSEGTSFRKLDTALEKSKDFVGFHSIEKISNLDGVWLGNIMDGYGTNIFFPKIQSKISKDDGRSWRFLDYEPIDATKHKTKVYCDDINDCHLNILNAIEMTGDGHFQSGPTPGILYGVGAVSNSLVYDYDKLSTWVSTNGGYSWSVAIDEPCVFSTGDQGNVVVAVPYFSRFKLHENADRSKFFYSTDHGKTFQTGKLDHKILPTLLTTTTDGSSQKFVFAGFNMDGRDGSLDAIRNGKYELYSLDFSNIFDGKACGQNDMEEFVARSESKDTLCIMGHKEVFLRRKEDAKCFVNQLYKDVAPIRTEACGCIERDYECQKGFEADEDGKCQPDFRYFRHVCMENPTLESEMSKLAKIPGNTCDEGASDSWKPSSDERFAFKCQDILKDSASNDIQVSRNSIPSHVQQYVYLSQSKDVVDDETILIVTRNRRLYISHNGGMEYFWASVDGDDVLAVMENHFNGDNVVVVTPLNRMYYSTDRAKSFVKVPLPSAVNPFGFVPFHFHPNDTSKLMFIGASDQCSKSRSEPGCTSTAFLTEDAGATWTKLVDKARSCDFAGARFKTDDALLICEVLNSDRSAKIISSTSNFKESTVHFEHAVGIAPDDGFLIVADIVKEEGSLRSYTTVDGLIWAHAKFPHDFKVGKEQAYTVISSNSKSVYLHVTTNNNQGQEMGAILKSNSNGTSYVLSEERVNRDTPGYVDFEKIEGVEGVSIVNVVSNYDEVLKGSQKKLKTKITHNDGAEWAYLAPPAVDSQGKQYACSGKSFMECSLNLHGFTERVDYRDTYSSGSAVGMLVGIGNVGQSLGSRAESATFLTRDGGITWKEIYPSPMGWEYGDQGGILVLVDQVNPTNELLYSLDEGDTWSKFQFHSNKVNVEDIVTIPSDTSRRFIILSSGELDDPNSDKFSLVFGIDFSGVFARQCKLDLDDLDLPSEDFEYWTPKHPFLADDCLFGHEARYLRRKPRNVDCFVGSAPLNEGFRIIRNCSCTRRDYECDYNFARSDDGTCKLVKGLKPKDPKEMCVNDKAYEYFQPTGYRKLPMSTCVGGQQLDMYDPKPCPGKESQFNRNHGTGLNGFNLFMVVVVPAAVFVFASWFVYDKGIRRNGGFTRLGQIRLEEGDGDSFGFPTRVENNTTDKIVNRIVDLGVMAFMGSVALIHFLGKMRKNVASGRNPFSSGRSSYTAIGSNQVYLDDEDELLGSEDDGEDEGDTFINAGDEEFDDDARSLRSDVLEQ